MPPAKIEYGGKCLLENFMLQKISDSKNIQRHKLIHFVNTVNKKAKSENF